MPRRSPFRWVLALLLALAGPSLVVLLAQPPDARRYAVLVGINEYQHPKLRALRFAEADVVELADLLRKAGYEVTLLTGSAADDDLRPTRANIERQVHDVLRKCRAGDTALLAFTGHGLQFEGKDDCYFCPADARPFADETDSLVSLSQVYGELNKSFAGMKVLLVDACRDDPEALRGARGLNADSAPRPPQGVAALFSCRAGERAYESEKLGHGVFFYHVLKGLRGEAEDRKGRVTFAGLAAYVSQEVAEGDRGVSAVIGPDARQSPNLMANYSTEPVLLAPHAVARTVTPRAQAPRVELPRVELKEGGALLDLGGGTRMELVRVPRGSFLMGSPDGDRLANGDEKPQHPVEITRDYYLGRCEVTRGQFRRFVEETGFRTDAERDGKGGYGHDPQTGTFDGRRTKYTWKYTGFEQTDEHPVVNVTWDDAQAFCKWLARRTGKAVRLPTEAEWEYACRAGTTTRYAGGDGENDLAGHANVADLGLKRALRHTSLDYPFARFDDGFAFTAPVGQFKPNRFGLADMHGNVCEWCQDWYGKGYYAGSPKQDPAGPDAGNARVLRGGSWCVAPEDCRSAFRGMQAPGFRYYDVGFRVVLRPE